MWFTHRVSTQPSSLQNLGGVAEILHMLKCCGEISFKYNNRVSPSHTTDCDDEMEEKYKKHQTRASGISIVFSVDRPCHTHKHTHTPHTDDNANTQIHRLRMFETDTS